jgi:hypothetical protein
VDVAPAEAAAPVAVIWQRSLSGSAVGAVLDRNNDIVVGATTRSSGNLEIALAKYAQDGTQLWLEEYGGPADQVVGGLTLAPDGSLLVTGGFNGMTDFGGQSRTTEGDQNRDLYLAAYTSAGALSQVLTFGGPGSEAGSVVLVDGPSGDWFLTGWGGPLVAAGQSVSGNFVIRVSPTGQVRWIRQGGTSLVSLPNGGDLISGGDVTGQQLTRHARVDGAPVWVKDLGVDVEVDEMAIDREGNLLAAVSFQSTATFGSRTFTSAGKRDTFLVAFSPASGDVLWARTLLVSQGEDRVLSMCQEAGNPGDIWMAGTYGGGSSFQPGEAAATSASGFVARHRRDGTRRWIQALPFTGGVVFGLSCEAPGGVIITYNGGVAKLT